jgi:hypothetical protein
LDYNETEDLTFSWKKRGETDPPTAYKPLSDLAKNSPKEMNKFLPIFLMVLDTFIK